MTIKIGTFIFLNLYYIRTGYADTELERPEPDIAHLTHNLADLDKNLSFLATATSLKTKPFHKLEIAF